MLGVVAIGLIGLTSGAMIILAARAALAANAQVITVLRLIGATDAYIEAAFVRRLRFAHLSAQLWAQSSGRVLCFSPAKKKSRHFNGSAVKWR